jgi:hypothetical protein
MDAFTRLSLMAKAQRVFESEDTFLSFPALSPITYEPDDLRFAGPVDMTPQVLAAMSEFARITNAIPRGAIAPQEQGEYLWDVYGEVLETAQLAGGVMSASEKARYEQAMSLLYVRVPDGTVADSEALRQYKQLRDAHIGALENYKYEQCTAELSEDAAVQARWRDEDEPRLRQEIKQLDDRWRTEGRKGEIEEAQQIEQAGAARAPSLIWDAWKTSFMSDLDTQTDTNLINYAATGFSPYDCVDADTWPQFALTRPEMVRLSNNAPADLVEALGSGAEEDIQRVTFEYRSVAVTRPWFKPALFKSRVWRLPNGAAPLSEDAGSLRGRCPAYITAIVFARNVRIERSTQRAAEPTIPAGRDALHRRPRLPGDRRPVRDHRSGAPAPRVVVRHRPGVGDRRRPGVSLERVGFSAVRGKRRPEPRRPTAVPTPSVEAPTSELTIIAFICKRVPRCPDPDPALLWT